MCLEFLKRKKVSDNGIVVAYKEFDEYAGYLSYSHMGGRVKEGVWLKIKRNTADICCADTSDMYTPGFHAFVKPATSATDRQEPRRIVLFRDIITRGFQWEEACIVAREMFIVPLSNPVVKKKVAVKKKK